VLKAKSNDQQSAASTIIALKKKLANKQFTRRDAHRDAEACSKAAWELKEMADQLLA
jgi:hypothetical protein